MDNYKVRITTQTDGSQIGVKVYSATTGESYQEFKFGQYNIEYFDENEIKLEDGDYPDTMFEQVIVAAPIISPEQPVPISTYRGLMVKEEFKKYK